MVSLASKSQKLTKVKKKEKRKITSYQSQKTFQAPRTLKSLEIIRYKSIDKNKKEDSSKDMVHIGKKVVALLRLPLKLDHCLYSTESRW
uniref:Uncharacterized protein n=1 Tax=Trichogramma kaykai TaxID=54128 RepID=A0ABD2VVI3_9HYME